MLLGALLTAAANLMLRAGIDRAGGFSPAGVVEVVTGFVNLLLQPVFSLGFVIYFLAALIWFRIVDTEPLSIAYPVLVSLTFILVIGGSAMFFQEAVTTRKLLGAAAILVGIAMLSAK